MPDPERKPHIPPWAERERVSDFAWIAENRHVLWPAARAAYEAVGRGALIVDTTSQPEPDKGNPFAYFTQEQIGEFNEKSEKEEPILQDTLRMVAEYDPDWEFVALLLKEQRESVYRVGVPKAKSEGSQGAGSGRG